MNVDKYFIKKYTPIYKTGSKICIGYVGAKEYIEVTYNTFYNKLLHEILKHGIDKKKLKKSFYHELYEKNFIEKCLPLDYDLKTNRGELFLEYLLSSSKNDNLIKAKTKPLLVFGAGAGGSTLVYLLAQFGFCNITIIDFDTIEESDLKRVSIFDSNDLGNKKIFALKEKINNNFSIDINIIDGNLIEEIEIDNIIQSVQPEFIIKACDPVGRFLTNLNKVCFKQKIPYISMAYSYESLKIGPLIIPELTSCIESLSKLAVDNYGEHYKIEKFERLYNEFLFHPSISFNINILSSIIFKEILFFLIEEFEYCMSIGRMLIFNPLNLSVKPHLIKCDENCKICYYKDKKL